MINSSEYNKEYYLKNKEHIHERSARRIRCTVCDKDYSNSHKSQHYNGKFHILHEKIHALSAQVDKSTPQDLPVSDNSLLQREN